jgi:hypothetical protein
MKPSYTKFDRITIQEKALKMAYDSNEKSDINPSQHFHLMNRLASSFYRLLFTQEKVKWARSGQSSCRLSFVTC